MSRGVLVPDWLLQREELSDSARLFFARLLTARTQLESGRFTSAQVSSVLGISERMLRARLSLLRRCGLLTIKQRGRRPALWTFTGPAARRQRGSQERQR